MTRAKLLIALLLCSFIPSILAVVAADSDRPSAPTPPRLTLQPNITQHIDPAQLPFSRNITALFKGAWKHRQTNYSTQASSFVLQRDAGEVVFRLQNTPSPVQNADFVLGRMLLRNGKYSTDDFLELNLRGVYFWTTGKLMLLGFQATRQPFRPSFDVSNNQTAMEEQLRSVRLGLLTNRELAKQDALKNADSALQELIAKDPQNNPCFFRFTIQMGLLTPSMKKAERELQQLRQQLQAPRLSYDKRALLRKQLRDIESDLHFDMHGFVASQHCGILMELESATVDLREYTQQALSYVAYAAVASIVELLLTIRQMDYSKTPSMLTKVSLLTVGEQAILDAYSLLIHLTFGLYSESVFNAFALIGFCKLVQFSIFEMRYLLSIWKARNPTGFNQGWARVRRELGTLYMRFYGFMLGGVFLVFQLRNHFYLFVFLLYSFWIPQIYCSASRDTKHPLLSSYIIGMSIARLAIPLYFYGYADNMIHGEPNTTMCWALICWVAAQAIVLHLQDVFGPRFFVPARFLPEKYNYRRPIPDHLLVEGQDIDCVICMTPVDIQARDWMIARCDHVFHAECLQRWMDIKLECPTCRGGLDPE